MEKFPQAFVDRIQKILPEGEWADFFAQATEPLPKVVRVIDETLKSKSDWQLRPTHVSEGFFIDRDDQTTQALGKTLEHFTGKIYSQSLSSMLPVDLLDPQPGESLLDMCAAPGSKTTFISHRMADSGVLVANELSSTRSKKLVANLNRLGVTNTVLLQSDGTILDHFIEPMFDKVLLDAPCSSEGFGRRDAKFFSQMWSESAIKEMSKLQRRLIVSGFNLLNVGGIMSYSTCTSAPEENEVIVQHLLDTFPGAVEILPVAIGDLPHHPGLVAWEGQEFDPTVSENVVRLYPHMRNETWNSESFFVCLIRKLAPTPPIQKKAISTANTHKVLKKNQVLETVTRLRKQFGLPKDWAKGKSFIEKNGALYLTTKPATQFCNTYLWRRVGLPIMDKDGNITTEFAMHFGPLATTGIYDLDATEKNRWLEGYDLSIKKSDNQLSDQLLVRYQSHFLGWGKVLPGKLKNKLPRDRTFTQ